MAQVRGIAGKLGLEPHMCDFSYECLSVRFHPVVHTNHLYGGYLIRCQGWTVAWAPEFCEFPDWVAGLDLMFGEASGWDRPIRFVGGVGGNME